MASDREESTEERESLARTVSFNGNQCLIECKKAVMAETLLIEIRSKLRHHSSVSLSGHTTGEDMLKQRNDDIINDSDGVLFFWSLEMSAFARFDESQNHHWS
jgi:hypothetical protein